ncbi:ATP-grasp domain-containing protein [Piscinibacter sakaiensis]|uniref:COG1821 family protein n=1 Tax=Piscinibacter sakaiensis TaxID=1547922 RepID=A0A0K8P5D9_PISS1|nr:ATP-grasp domain-containing protein [Piscinibacter sakaiensis]GAP37724.1 COG1821 family protein [Piscinibacter sakaiensis]
MRRILVYEALSGGPPSPAAADPALQAQGRAMRDALLEDLRRLPGLRVSCALPPAGSAGDLDDAAAGAVRPHPGETDLAFLCRAAAAHELVWGIAPETGGQLAAWAAALPAAAWLGCTPAAIAQASSKRATLARLAAAGLATPWTVAPALGPAPRWVVKPDDGAGTCDARVFAARGEAEAWAAQLAAADGAPPQLEPWVDGEALSVALVAGGGEPARVLAVNRQRIVEEADGRLADAGVAVDALGRAGDPRVAAVAAFARRAVDGWPGLAGLVGLDLVWHPRLGPVAIELNPRPTCALVGLSAAAGENVAAEVLRRHARALATRRETAGA